MINYLEKTGKTDDEAIAAALEEIGLDRDDVSVEIIERAKPGFLGIGSVPARVRISWETEGEEPAAPAPVPEEVPAAKEEIPAAPAAPEKKSEPAAEPVDEPEDYARVRSFLTGLLEHMDLEADITISEREGGGLLVDLAGPGMGAVIGRRGETLDAIQHLTNYAVNHGNEKHLRISVDAENYRAKREESLTRLAEKMAEKAIKYKRSMALEPMNSYERHVIHTALQDYEGVTTASTGTEPNRRVVVSYVRSEQPASRKPQSREWA
ncbi:MAG: RNA-binding cell elongation regulator Jag/EloR [Candidatus Limivicinus sp.]|jgi:spoIIIJ-associated protein